ncbi:MAG: LacI family DNA-binding transcriptional regulator [Clostridia bacterium]
MNKKSTNKDVAKMANVSIATVSYVMNNRQDKRISPTTVKKVLQVANFLNYVPNPYAVNLSSNTTHNILVRTSARSCPLQNYETILFLHKFNCLVVDNNFTLLYSPDHTPNRLVASACVCIDLTREEFFELGNENYMPLVGINCELNDPVFYQINCNYVKLKNTADSYFNAPYTYLAIMPNDERIKVRLLKTMPNTVFVSTMSDILHLNLSTSNVVVSEQCLIDAISQDSKYNVMAYTGMLEQQAQTLISCINNAIDRVDTTEEAHYIVL